MVGSRAVCGVRPAHLSGVVLPHERLRKSVEVALEPRSGQRLGVLGCRLKGADIENRLFKVKGKQLRKTRGAPS